jgi:hypothetical protein
VRPYAGCSLTVSRLSSDQNHFDPDPARLTFEGSYYDYDEVRLAPSVSFVFLKPNVTFDLTYEWAYRKYGSRTTQNASDGTYTSDILDQHSQTVGLGLSWGFAPNLDFKLRGTYADSSSNMQYEQTYRYNYRSSNYFGGVEWRL